VDQQRDGTHPGRQRRSSAIGGIVEAALRQNRFLFAYQPVVCAATGRVDYFECLLRMRDEAGNIVAGGEFITAVEHFGLIGLIDRFVLERAVQELSAYPEVRLGFNVSGLTACDRPWLRLLISRLRNRPDLTRRLIVEITETAALHDIEESARFVDTLRDTAAASRWMTSAPDTPHCGTCKAWRWTRSRSTARLSETLQIAAKTRSFCATFSASQKASP
jgi:predicted signal transduction protein with EAL and GGDEF domain